VIPYKFDDLAIGLNQVVKYDWAGFLNDRVSRINPKADLEGIEQGGYKMVYTGKPTSYESAYLKDSSSTPDLLFSLGLEVDAEGVISDVRMAGPADLAKLAPTEKILQVNGIPFSMEGLHAAIRAGKDAKVPIRLLVRNDLLVFPVELDYHGGEMYPDLERVEGTPAYLDEISFPSVSESSSTGKTGNR
jgi:predicted metalloprotease with PDZ domain